MSKPQVASEPSLEEILTSIRKMISDEKPGPSPMPDQMGRTPFGETARRAPGPDVAARGSDEPTGAPRTSAAAPSNFNSLSDALKVATALSDQRRSLQQEIANVLEKGPRSNLDALAEISAARTQTDSRSGASRADSGQVLTAPVAPRSEAPTGEAKRDLLSFDFGAVVPQREEQHVKPSAAEPKPAAATPSSTAAAGIEVPATKSDAKSEQPAESRVLQLRAGQNGSAAHGLSGAAVNVAPFPRPVRETAKPTDTGLPAAPAEKAADPHKAPEPAGKQETVAAAEPAPVASTQIAASEAAAAGSELASARSEALLDAVVDLVQQQPNAMSVFTSGAAFIGGITGEKADAQASPAADARSGEVKSEAADAPAVGAAKMDGVAAELLRPMLRQWLAENMERILEDALRSEISGKGPGKT